MYQDNFVTCSHLNFAGKKYSFIFYIYNIMFVFILYMYDSVLTMKTEVAIGYTQEPIINKSIQLTQKSNMALSPTFY